MTDREHDDLDVFEDALREDLDEQLDATPVRDFLDVIGRVRDLTLEATDDALLADARALDEDAADPIADLPGSEAAQLDAINADVRALLDGALDGRKLSAIPPARLPRGRRPRWAWAAAAAVVLMAGAAGAASLAQSYWTASDASETFATEAEDAMAPQPSGGTAIQAPASRVPEAETSPELPIAPTTPEAAPEAPAPTDEPPASPGSQARKTAQLETLDAEAYALFRAGDLRGAEKKFRRITKIGGRSEYAEIAYGELFSIARQIGGAESQEKLWRAYLRRFPRGRYADGAQAGLCRRAKDQARDKCWTRYLDNHPKGAARGEAIRGTAGLP